MPETMHYYCNCVSWPQSDVHSNGGLSDMVDSNLEITRRTFLKHVNRNDLKKLERQLGYDSNLHMTNDYHVSYHRSKLHGKRVYYFCHSAIEYVFTKE